MATNSALKRSNVTTLSSVFKTRVDTTPKNEAFRFYNHQSQAWQSINWLDAYQQMLQARQALLTENLQAGDRILLAFRNSPSWVYVEQAALYMGLVVVALPAISPASTICQAANEVDAKIIFTESDNIWHALQSNPLFNKSQTRVICHSQNSDMQSAVYFEHWIKTNSKHELKTQMPTVSEEALATVMYTSGSCGKPKGVKHSHKNLINNAYACLDRIDVNEQDKMLSVTPISHCMERIAGYYVAMIAGACIVFPKSTETILEDLKESKATILVTTPYHLNKAYKRLLNNLVISAKLVDQYMEYLHGNGKWRLKFLFWPLIRGIVETKAKKLLLNQLKYVISGGSALSPKIISLSAFLNLPVLQGYGLTEAGGVVSTNSIDSNKKFSVGKPLINTKIRLKNKHELLVQNDCLMLGYWNEEEPALINDRWLQTEDLAHLDSEYLFIEGRKNETIHLSTGEAVLPSPVEHRLIQDNLFENVMLYGEGKANLSLFCALNHEEWSAFRAKYAKRKELTSDVITERLKSILLVRVNAILQTVPGHPRVNLIFPTLENWTIENGLLNGHGKIDKKAVEKYFADDIAFLD